MDIYGILSGWWFQPINLKNMSEESVGMIILFPTVSGKSFKIPWFQSPPTRTVYIYNYPWICWVPKKYHTHNRDSPENGGSSGKFSEAPLLQLLVLLLQQIPAVSAIYWLKLVISGIIYFISGYSSVLITGKGP